MVFEWLFSVIKLPDNLTNEKVEPISSHTADASHLALHDAPETFDVVGVDVTAHVLIPGVVDELMNVTEIRNSAIHFEAVGVDARAWDNAFLNGGKDVRDVEFLRLDVDKDLAGISAKEANDGQFICAVASLSFNAANVQPLVLPLPANVRLVHLDDARKRHRNFCSHDRAQMMGREPRGFLADTDLFCNTGCSTFTKKDCHNNPPLFLRDPKSLYRIYRTTEFSLTFLALEFFSPELPKSAVATKRT